MKAGDVVPEFEVVDQDGAPITLTELLGHGPLVLYFYIRAMTPG